MRLGVWCEFKRLTHVLSFFRADSRLAPSQWEMLLQSNTISHWLGANLESNLFFIAVLCSMQYHVRLKHWSGDTKWHQRPWPSLFQEMAWCLLGTKPLPEPVLIYLVLDTRSTFRWNLIHNYNIFIEKLCIWNCHLQNFCHYHITCPWMILLTYV